MSRKRRCALRARSSVYGHGHVYGPDNWGQAPERRSRARWDERDFRPSRRAVPELDACSPRSRASPSLVRRFIPFTPRLGGNAMTARRGRNGVFRRSALPSDGRVAQRARHFERSQIQAKASTKIDASVRLGGALAAIQLRRRGRRELRRWDPRIDAGARRRWSIVTECRRELSPIQDRRVDVCVASKAALTSRQR
jgi:hypothetical protein